MADANPVTGELSTPYTRRIHKICSKMSDAELSEFPDVLCVRDAHALVFGAAVDLTRPGLPLVDCLSASGRYLRGCRLGLATGLDLPAPPPSSLYEALRAANAGVAQWPTLQLGAQAEQHVGEMFWLAWLASRITQPHNRGDASRALAGQLQRALRLWRSPAVQGAAVERLRAIGVQDFDPNDLLIALVTHLSTFYLDCPEGAPEVRKGLPLLEE
jgi:hypothetical protein